MDNKIKENIVKLIKNTKNPQTGEFFKIDDEVNIIVREKHVTITIQIDHQKLDLFKEVNSYLKEQIDSNKDILSSNIILKSISLLKSLTERIKLLIFFKNSSVSKSKIIEAQILVEIKAFKNSKNNIFFIMTTIQFFRCFHQLNFLQF